jgi:hypothetical protein
MLENFAIYALPDGTRVQAIEAIVPAGNWSIRLLDGTPLFLQDSRPGKGHLWQRLEYDPVIDGYACVPSDFTPGDLRCVQDANT